MKSVFACVSGRSYSGRVLSSSCNQEPVAAAPSPEAEKWLEENLGDIKNSIAEQVCKNEAH